MIFLLAIMYIFSEIKRMFGAKVPLFTDITKIAAGKTEYQGFVSSPLFFALGVMLSLLIFPEPVGYVSLTVLTLGDGVASVFGQIFGKTHVSYNKVKCVEGSVSGFFFSFFGSLLVVHPLYAFIACAIGMLVESLPLPLNDNLAVPLASGLAVIAFSSLI